MMLKHLTKIALGGLCGLGLLGAVAAPASARIIELGVAGEPPRPSCPADPCYALSRTTGYQVKVGEQRELFTVPRDGRIVAWSISLSKPDPGQTSSFQKRFGGPASAGITILRPNDKLYGRTLAVSPIEPLTPYFGETVQFPLERSLEVKKGYIVALTVPTWAPALAVGFGKDTSWRAASRYQGKCDKLETQFPQTRLMEIAKYRCLFQTARLTYSATLITSPVPPKAPAGSAKD